MSAAASSRAHVAARFPLPGGAVGFVESATAVPLVSIVVALRSGATSDPEGKDGLCRFATRMLRRGCAGLAAPELEAAIDALGAELSFDVGPTTTMIHGQVIRRNLREFCGLLGRILGSPTFAEEEIARLRRETVAEIVETRDNDRALAHVALRRALFAGHPFARSAAGRTSTIPTFTRDEVVAMHQRRFVRADLVVGFAGAVTGAEAEELGAALAATIPEGPSVPLEIPEPTAPVGRRLVFVDKPARTQTPILIGGLGTSPHDADHFPLVLATAIFGGTFTSRMMREIRSKRGWSYGTSARLSIERRRHAFVMSSAPGAADCAPCVRLELDLLADLVARGVSARELGFIKNYLTRSHAFDVDTAPKRLGHAVETETLGLPADYHSRFVEHVRAVALPDANAALARRLSPSDLVVVVVGTAGELHDKVRDAIGDLAADEVVPFDRD